MKRGTYSRGPLPSYKETGKYDAATLAAIDAYWRERCQPPTIRELMAATGCPSTSHMVHILRGLGLPDRTPAWVKRAIQAAAVEA